jgi:enoyl-CoA hydratase/carnithine racemase
VRGHVLLIGINRPAKRNGFTPKMYRELAWPTPGSTTSPLRVGVLHAFGEHFTAGLDLPTIAPLMQRGEKPCPWAWWSRSTSACPATGAAQAHGGGRQGHHLHRGHRADAGADIVVAADNCRFSQLEVKRGIMATGGATLRMAERAGLGNALLHLLTGDEFDSAEALRLNFVQKVVPAGQELDRPWPWPARLPSRPRRPWWPRARTCSRPSSWARWWPCATSSTQQRLSRSRTRAKACSPSSKSARPASAAAEPRCTRPCACRGFSQ